MHQSRVQHAVDPGVREALEAEARAEREKLTAERERKIEKIRG